jgi:hypothetical protein
MEKRRPEITWSLMHPTDLNVDYMRKVASHAHNYRVDSYEICAACHSPLGGLDGLVLYEDYPETAAAVDREAILANRRRLQDILDIAHAGGKPVYYWHREVTVAPGLLQAMPGLLDENGEFDLLGPAFSSLLCYKIHQAFAAVPDLDGVVLTLTEADYSVIHNSNADRYPPADVVAHIVRIFAGELKRLGKRFILRSFGSIAQDYEDILAGAAVAALTHNFEVETKITPYDFDPFLPVNPFLRRVPGTAMSAECDCLGEFLGAGYLPAENVANIVKYVHTGLTAGVDRFTIRIDRVGNNIFDNYEINLFAYHRAIDDPCATAEAIRAEWASAHYPAAFADALLEQGVKGFEMIARTNFIDGNVVFHQNPPGPDLKWLKAGGIFGVFKDNADLHMLGGIWSILAERDTPGRRNILAEKADAVSIALEQAAAMKGIQGFDYLKRLWGNAVIAARSIEAFVKCVCAYFDDMEAGLKDAPNLEREIAAAAVLLRSMMPEAGDGAVEDKPFTNGMDHGLFAALLPVEDVYPSPLLSVCAKLREEYRAEFTARSSFPNAYDLVISGGIADEYRIGRYMHASHSMLRDGVPMRWAGNRIFPNGFLDFELKRPGRGYALIQGRAPSFVATLDGIRHECSFGEDGRCRLPVPSGSGPLLLRLEKSGDVYPEIEAVVVFEDC